MVNKFILAGFLKDVDEKNETVTVETTAQNVVGFKIGIKKEILNNILKKLDRKKQNLISIVGVMMPDKYGHIVLVAQEITVSEPVEKSFNKSFS